VLAADHLAVLVHHGLFCRVTLRLAGCVVPRATARLLAHVGVHLTVFAVLHGAVASVAHSQVRPDSVRKDSVAAPVTPSAAAAAAAADSVVFAREVARVDSIKNAILADSIKAPIVRWEMPVSTEITNRLQWKRDEILSSGAVNLADLLDRVPGMTTFRTAWAAGYHAASLFGDFGRVRLFLDGVEMDAIEARNAGVLDLTDVQLWTLDEIVIERAAGEVRVWLRTWTVERTTPYTRVDIFTGDLNTNAFRGMFARRWRNGFLLQAGGQQVATQSGRVSAFGAPGQASARGDGTVQGVMSRLGWSRGRVSVDAFATVSSRERDGHRARENFTDLPAFKGSRREAYVRVGYGDTTRGVWSQALVGVLRTRLEGIPAVGATERPDLNDSLQVETNSIRGRTQQLLAVGYRGARWSVSLTNRLRPIAGISVQSPAARAYFGTSRYKVGAYAERTGVDSVRRVDLFARAQPLSWLAFSAARSSRTPDDSTLRVSSGTVRAEAAIRLRDVWVGGGVIRADESDYTAPQFLGTPSALLSALATQGLLVSARGRLYKDVQLDVQAVRWDEAQFGRPRMQVRTEVAMVSNWLRQFPKGEFGINLRLAHELRDPVPFFYGTGSDGAQDIRLTARAQVVIGTLELRIQRATLFYQYRNLTGGDYEQIPGITMPPGLQVYGVRWEFWN